MFSQSVIRAVQTLVSSIASQASPLRGFGHNPAVHRTFDAKRYDANDAFVGLDSRTLEHTFPAAISNEQRIQMAERCRDSDSLKKVPMAGQVLEECDGTRVQIMYNGVKVIAGGYCGDWMEELIRRCSGHHEPQEEVLFAEVMKHAGPAWTMIELGGFWSFYSIWFLRTSSQRRCLIVEPDPAHLEVGRVNARLNDCSATFIHASAAAAEAVPTPFSTESSGVLGVPAVSVESLMRDHEIPHLNILHCDAQGAEVLVLEGCSSLFAAGRVDWVFVSTHSHLISGDPLTHQRCVAILRNAGAHVVADHDVAESFSGDGLILAKFGSLPKNFVTPALSRNRYSASLFRNPLFDLSLALSKIDKLQKTNR